MQTTIRALFVGMLAALVFLDSSPSAQTSGQREEFTAIGIANDDLGSGAGTIIIQVNRWSTEAEQKQLINSLRVNAPEKVIDDLRRMRSVGSVRTPGTLAYDLHYSQEIPGEDGGRQILLITDRPIGFAETWHQPPSVNYPYYVIQMQMDRENRGTGTLSYAARIAALGKWVEIENFSTAPIKLTKIEGRKRK